jgi:type I restriction enzyme M protein
MRTSACGFIAESLEEALELSKRCAAVTHNHPEGIKGGEAIAVCTYLALHGAGKAEIRRYVNDHYYTLDFTLDGIRSTYRFNETCMDTIPRAIEAFLEAEDFEDAIRNAISIGGDSDTLGACTGAIAEAFFGIPEWIRDEAQQFLDRQLSDILIDFEDEFPPKITG